MVTTCVTLLPLVTGEVMVCTEDMKSGVGLWHAVITVSDLLCEREGRVSLVTNSLYREHNLNCGHSVYLCHFCKTQPVLALLI